MDSPTPGGFLRADKIRRFKVFSGAKRRKNSPPPSRGRVGERGCGLKIYDKKINSPMKKSPPA
jgi:hypothetical protein